MAPGPSRSATFDPTRPGTGQVLADYYLSSRALAYSDEVVGSGPPLLMFAPGGFDAQISKWSDLGVYKRIRLQSQQAGDKHE